MSVKKKSGTKEIVDPKNLRLKKSGVKKDLNPKNVWVNYIFVSKKFQTHLQKDFGGKQILERKKNWGQKMLGPKKWVKNDRSKRIWAKYILWGKMVSQKYWA